MAVTIIVEQLLFVLIVIIMAVSLNRQKTVNEKLDIANRVKHESTVLADQLRQTSDDLTRMVRTYAVTGEVKYKHYFQEILDIRNGLIPRPVNYNNIFWDIKVVKDSLFEYDVIEPVSLNALLQDVGITQEEFDLLNEAKRRSDKLVEMENIAMHALIGEYTNKWGVFEKSGEPDREFALNILFCKEYHNAKMEIMSSINMFFTRLYERTVLIVEDGQRAVAFNSTLIQILFAFIVINIVVLIVTIRKYHHVMFGKLNKSLEEKTEEVLERKRAESLLKTARDYIESIINSMPVVLIGVDKECIVTHWNRTAEDITGIEVKTAMGKLISAVYPNIESEIKTIRESMRIGEIVKSKRRVIKTTAGTRYESITIYPLSTMNNCGAVIICNDIGREIETEQRLNQRTKMDSIGELAGGVAHDFNNMLSGIMGAAQLLQASEENFSDESKEYINLILAACNHTADLTAKLLAFGRKGEVVSTKISIHSVIDDAAAIIRRTIDKKIHVVVKKNAELAAVVGDNSAIQSAIMNLCINASHAIDGVGQITITTKNIYLERSYCEASSFDVEQGNYIAIEIQDTGSGIPDTVINKIFEPFFTTKEQGKGTGLGLSAVYGTVELHHGVIQVYSEMEVGTVFHIYLPCSGDSDVIINHEHPVIKGSGTILLVDDEEILRLTGQRMLKHMGYEVDVAVNGVEGVELFAKHPDKYDLVILDMIMPKMNGSEAYLKMKEIDENCNVIIASGFTKDENISELKKQGLKGFIHKPYSVYELSMMLSKNLEN